MTKASPSRSTAPKTSPRSACSTWSSRCTALEGDLWTFAFQELRIGLGVSAGEQVRAELRYDAAPPASFRTQLSIFSAEQQAFHYAIGSDGVLLPEVALPDAASLDSRAALGGPP